MTIKILKAYNGDCFLISFKDNFNNLRNILIDGGREATYYDASTNSYGELKSEIDAIREKKEFIDLLILTHIDNDHICGLLKWFELDIHASKLIKNVWFNSGKIIAEFLGEPENADLKVGLKIFNNSSTGVNEGIEFEEYLKEKKIWDRKIVMKGQEFDHDGIKIHILSPDPSQLKKLLREYKAKTGAPEYTTGKESDWTKDIKELIDEEGLKDFKFFQDTSVKNGSSISFILNLNNRNFLFLADSHPKGIVKALKELKYSRENPLEVELFKVSHHGSKSNTSKELLDIIKTNNYIISTDSSGHGHPSKKTLARIIENNPNAVLHFNYEYVKENIINRKDFSDYSNFKVKVTQEFNF